MPSDGVGPDGVHRERARKLASAGRAPNPERLVAEVNNRAACDLEFVGVADHGESGGAVYVRWPDGRDGVLTRSPASLQRMHQTADVLAAARATGLPVPLHEVIIELADGTVALVQERLPGTPAGRVDAEVIDLMVATNERFAGLLADRPDVPRPPMDRIDRPEVARLENHSDRSRRLLRRIRDALADAPDGMTGDDLLHPDYTFGNVLYDASRQVTGVVDWNWGALRGDRHFALVTIYIDLFWSLVYPGGVDQSAFDRLDQVVEKLINPQRLRRYWAEIALGQLTYWIVEDNEKAVDLFLRFGEYRL